MLQKDTITTYIPGSPGQPYIPAVPAHPAYCEDVVIVTREFVVNRYRCFLGDESSLTIGQTPGQICVPVSGHFVTGTTRVRTCHPASGGSPAVPAVPAAAAQWLTNHNLGWNAGAHSVERHPADCYVSFKIPGASGVLVGFNHLSSGAGFNEIAHGIYFQASAARVYESGAAKGEVLSFVPTDTFIVERVNEQVTYYRKPVGASPVRMYKSLVASTGSIIVDASMYAGGDRID